MSKRSEKHLAWLLGAASAVIALAVGNAVAEDAGEDRASPPTSETIVVPGHIAYRNRVEDTPAPVLVYELDYFQRFEPLTVGDMLKRTPSATFISDMLEFDGVQLRGLDPGYTQVLINGEKVPGSGVDRSFFVDRIPAELVERVEIVRSQSANRSGDAVAGALNIVLRDAYALDGGFARVGALMFDDGRIKETLGGVYGGAVGPGRLLIGANVQGRRNPKAKESFRYEEPPAIPANFTDREDQSDVRDGRDYSLNANYTLPVGPSGELELSGFYVRTDRTESEFSREYNDATSTAEGNLLSITPQLEDIKQDNYTLKAGYKQAMFGGESKFKLVYSRFEDDIVSTETEYAFDDDTTPTVPDGLESTRELTDSSDEELAATVSHKRPLTEGLKLEFGVDYTNKNRDTNISDQDVELSQTQVNNGDPIVFDPDDFGPVNGGLYTIEERRIDPFVLVQGDAGSIEWEAGVRYETTDVDINNLDDEVTASTDYQFFLPSAHIRWDVTEQDRFSFSVARTVRRPNFDFIAPALLDGEYGDNDFLGNPFLKPENAWGIDAGYERRIGRQGVIGINVFYRDVKDVIELFNTGAPSEQYEDDLDDYETALAEFLLDNPGSTAEDFDEDPPELISFLYSARNTGDGTVWGVELDLSTPLSFIGLDDTGVFLSYSWLDSEIEDEFGERRFNNQAVSIFNVGFIQDLPSIGMAFGASYRKQGHAESRVLAEEVITEYGGDLEAFVEKRFGDKFTLRFTGTNLLNASKDEFFNKFDNGEDQVDRDFDEYELESEKSGPVYQLVGRFAF